MTLRYVYGIVPAAAAARLAERRVPGIDGYVVETLVEGPLAAAYSEVPESDYATEELNERVRDLSWLTPRAEAHQEVNARLLDVAGSVIPLSFGALYRDDGRVREMLREDAARRAERLDALRGKAEWVVTVVRESAPPGARADLERLDREIAESTPGRAFLLEKRRTSVATEATERADADASELTLAALSRVAERAYREPVAGGGEAVVARASLLAPLTDRGRVEEGIARLARELSGRGYGVRTTGPWPAYRFGALP